MAAAAADTVERVYSTLELLLHKLTVSSEQRWPTLFSLAIRCALHPLLAPFREDPLLTLSGEYISLDARVASLRDEILQQTTVASSILLRDFPDDDLTTLGEPRTVDAGSSSAAPLPPLPQLGNIGGALYLPAHGVAARCRIRAFFSPGSRPERVGMERPICVRAAGAAVESSAISAQSAALLYLEASGLLPTGSLPGTLYYDICGPDLGDDLLPHVHGPSLGLPLLLAFLSAFTGEPIGADVGATGALEFSPSGGSIPLLPVGHVSEKAEAFQKGAINSRNALFLATAAVAGEPPSSPADHERSGIVTEVHALDEAISCVFPAEFQRKQRTTFHASENAATQETGKTAVFLTACLARDVSANLSAEDVLQWKSILAKALLRHDGVLPLPRAKDTLLSDATISARFESVSVAIRAANEAMQSLRYYPWAPLSSETHVATILPGFGVHCAPRDDSADTGGRATQAASESVRRAARIAEAANPGQVLLSASARENLSDGDDVHSAVPIRGSHRLHDLSPPVSLWEAETAGDPRQDAPVAGRLRGPLAPRSLDDLPHNLPFHLTPTIGRDEDIETIRRLAADRRRSASRLTTIVGVGGVGKTRVAQSAGAEALSVFSDGVWFVRIDGEAQSAEDIARSVAETIPLSIAGEAKRAAQESPYLAVVGESFADASALLILDGCESAKMNSAVGHFAAAFFSAAPHSAILATARSPIGIGGETIYPLPPLPPLRLAEGAEDPAAPGMESEFAAVDLFHTRARQASPGFTLSDPNDLRAAAALCRRLEGLPLAIELAAAHVRYLPLAEIAARLTGAAPQLRHQSAMNRILELSFALLDPPEQDLLCGLSVFHDGFDSDAATAMAYALQSDGEALQSLEDRFLIQRRRDGSARFDIHSLIQAFARRKLTASGAETEARGRHADYFAALSSRYGADEPDSDREASSFDRLGLDLSNLRGALEFLRVNEPTRVSAFIVDLSNFLRYRGHLREWRSWPSLAIRLLPYGRERPTELLARAHLCRAAAYMDTNAPMDAAVHLEIAYEVAVAADTLAIAAKALNQRGLLRTRTEDWEGALADFQESREINRRLRSRDGEVIALNNLGLVAARQGQNAAAQQWYREAAVLSRAIGDRRGLAVAAGNLGYLAFKANDLSAAQSHFEECLAEGRAMRDATRVAHGLLNLGDTLNRQEIWESGTPLLVIAEAMLKRQRHRTLAEATRHVAEAQETYGAERISALRQELSHLPLPELLRLDPSRYTPRRLRLPDQDGT